MDPTIVLLPSLLIGASSVAPLAANLEASGRSAVVADTDGATTPSEVAARYSRAAPDGPATWVAHSNAGLYLPRILRARPGDIGIFVDASIPGDDPAHVSASGPWLRTLERLAEGSGWLPPWTEWWPAEQLTELLPDPEQRQALREASPRLPLSYFTAEVDVPPDWHDIPAGYLSFDSFDGGYVGDRERMAEVGWPTRHLPGDHLSVLTVPAKVASAITELESSLRTPDGRA